MGFFDNLSRSWKLMKLSLSIVRQEKKLLMFPLFTGIAAMVIMASFIFPFFFFSDNLPWQIWVVVAFVVYVLLYFVGIYFMAALIGCATIKLEGGKPELADGFRTANQNLGRILQWAIVAAIVGLIIQALERAARDNIIARIVISMVGFAWTMATFFVVPVLIYEKLGVFKAIKRSGSVFKNTWGETFVGHFGFQMFFMLLGLVGVLFLLLGFYFGGWTFFMLMLVLAVAWWIFVACLSVATQGVFTAALYRYAVTGKVAQDYESVEDLIRH